MHFLIVLLSDGCNVDVVIIKEIVLGQVFIGATVVVLLLVTVMLLLLLLLLLFVWKTFCGRWLAIGTPSLLSRWRLFGFITFFAAPWRRTSVT